MNIIQYNDDVLADYQVSALLMAICYQGMNCDETSALTSTMVDTEVALDQSAIEGIIVNKHSKGMDHTGGTIDKLESIVGFAVELTTDEFIRNVNEVKMAIIGLMAVLAPVDKKLYELRDATANLILIPLIASSNMN